MAPGANKHIGPRKAVWGFGQLLPHIKRAIDELRILSAQEKDSLYFTIERAYHQIDDATKRESRAAPLTPNQENDRGVGINKIGKSQRREQFTERATNTRRSNPLLDEFLHSILRKA
jgi:hypothetical protein